MLVLMIVSSGVPVALAVGLVIGSILAHIDGRRGGGRPNRARLAAAVVGVVGWVLPLVLSFSMVAQFRWWPEVLPIVAGIVAVLIAVRGTTVPVAADRPVLDLRRRSALTFSRGVEVLAAAATTVVLALTVLGAGLLSSQDDEGRYALITIPVGDATASTEFFGWYYGLPVVVAAAVLVAVTLAGLHQIARGPRAHVDRAGDDLRRRDQSSVALRSATAALLLTLGSAWQLVAQASSLRTSIPRTEAGTIEFGTSFAALGPVLDFSSHCVVGLGLALVIAQLLGRRRVGTPADVESDHQAVRA
ncbi:hypothetical protein Q7F20_15115 [Curtobacterium sp. A7_M15]|uniref:hypothetical protein n=1 Tax=Curtobacterium sp. A7_M15 TaxID=3065241 RepID=UPI00273791C9|nr:hypothetical protein [Curtobacterium sp. A7_M15]MDP4334705.1 hypothetical protein [Curtobacterium sp. A7_M15]